MSLIVASETPERVGYLTLFFDSLSDRRDLRKRSGFMIVGKGSLFAIASG